jgi:hypothetical protein
MPKGYEDEIRDILKGMDRFPGDGPPRRRAPAARQSAAPGLALDPQRVMGGALLLMLFAWVLRGPWAYGYPGLLRLAGYISLASIALFIVALIMLFRSGRFGGMGLGGMSSMMGRQQTRWRGQVIEFPRRGGPLTGLRTWWRRTIARFSRRSGPNGPRPMTRGRDTFQW